MYVGDYSVRTRERIWVEVAELLEDGSAAMAWTATTDSGFSFETLGPNRREPVDLDGLTLVQFKSATDGNADVG